MAEMTPEILQMLLQIGGTPALIGFVLYFMWTHGPKADLQRMADTVSDIREDLHRHRDAVLNEQAGHRERIQRLEILTEQAVEERQRLFRIKVDKSNDNA